MRQKPLISIITTTKNNEQTIESTLTSLLSQTFQNFEVIIKDKNSIDGTVNILKKYSKQIAYWESSADQNIYDGLNIAATHCNGDWTLVIQSGDQLYNSTILHQVAPILSKAKEDIIYGNVISTAGNGTRLHAAKPLSFLPYGMIGSHQAMFIRTPLLRRFPYDISYRVAADYDFLWKCVASGAKFKQIDLVIAQVDGAGFSSVNQVENHKQKNEIARKYSTALLPRFYRFIKRLRVRLQLKKRISTFFAKFKRQ